MDSDNSEPESIAERRQRLAAMFELEVDPLAKHAQMFEGGDVDPFELFQAEILQGTEYAEGTRTAYRRLIRQWRAHMAREGRHPACPNEQHIQLFAEYYLEKRENQPDTVRAKLRRLNNIYQYWQREAVFPHPRDYNPFLVVLSKLDLRRPQLKDPPRIPIEELRAIVADVTQSVIGPSSACN